MRQIGMICLAGAGLALGGLLASSLASESDGEPAAEVDFRRDVYPVLKGKCLRCHNPKKKEGALDMSTRDAMLKGGNTGPALVPGDSEKSLVIELIHFDEMPPLDKKPRVTKAELSKLRAWVDAGASVDSTPDP